MFLLLEELRKLVKNLLDDMARAIGGIYISDLQNCYRNLSPGDIDRLLQRNPGVEAWNEALPYLAISDMKFVSAEDAAKFLKSHIKDKTGRL